MSEISLLNKFNLNIEICIQSYWSWCHFKALSIYEAGITKYRMLSIKNLTHLASKSEARNDANFPPNVQSYHINLVRFSSWAMVMSSWISGHVGPISGHVGRFRVMVGQFHRFHRFPHTRMICIIGLGELLPWLSIWLLFHVPRLDVFTRKVLYWLTLDGLWLVDGRLVCDWSMSKGLITSVTDRSISWARDLRSPN